MLVYQIAPDPREALIAQDILNLINFTAAPEIYNWPGTAWFYLIAGVGKVLSICGMDMTEARVIWIARFINVLFSIGSIWLTYCLGTRCYKQTCGTGCSRLINGVDVTCNKRVAFCSG